MIFAALFAFSAQVQAQPPVQAQLFKDLSWGQINRLRKAHIQTKKEGHLEEYFKEVASLDLPEETKKPLLLSDLSDSFRETVLKEALYPKQVSAGYFASCVLLNSQVWCWGSGLSGKENILAGRNVTVPVKVLGLQEVEKIAVGEDFAFALQRDKKLWFWGKNHFFLYPEKTPEWKQMNQKESSLISLRMWTEREVHAVRPIPLLTIDSISDFALGRSYLIVLTEQKELWGWGEAMRKELEYDLWYSTVPKKLSLKSVDRFGVGISHSMAVDEQGKLWKWGDGGNFYDGKSHHYTQNMTHQIVIPGLEKIQQIQIGWAHSVILDQNGKVWSWDSHSGPPHVLQNLPPVRQIAAGSSHTLALTQDHRVYFWGSLRDSITQDSPRQLVELENIVSISAGWQHDLAIDQNGAIWSWGANFSKQLGRQTQDNVDPVPREIYSGDVFEREH